MCLDNGSAESWLSINSKGLGNGAFFNMKSHLLFLLLASLAFSCQDGRDNNASESAESAVRDSVIRFDPANEIVPTWRDDNTIIFHVLGEPDDMHPLNSGSALGRLIQSYIHGYLVATDQEVGSGFVPSLVRTMPKVSDDGLRYTYELRDDVKWDDGTSLTVDDVIFSLKAGKCPLINNPHYRPYISALREVEVSKDNPHQFTIIMAEPNLLNIGFVTIFPMMQEQFWDKRKTLRKNSFTDFNETVESFDEDEDLNEWATETNQTKYGRSPDLIVGIGPYQFSDWQAGQQFTLTRKPDHWSVNAAAKVGLFEKGYPDKIIFKINRDPNSQLLEFKSQVYDGSASLSTSTYNELVNDSAFMRNYNAAEAVSYTYSYLGFNCRPDGVAHKKIFSDVMVRKAVASAIPYDEINQILYRGRYSRLVGPVSPLKEEYHHGLDLINKDLQRCKLLLDSAGWIDTDGDNIRDKVVDGERIPLQFELNYMSAPTTWKDLALMIAESLWEVGVKCDPVPMTFAVHKQKNRSHDFDAMLGGRAGSSFPEDFTQVWHTRSWSNNGSNYAGFGNHDSDELIDSIKVTIEPEERTRLVRRFQEMVYEDQPYVFLFSYTKKVVAHKRFNNVSVYSDQPHLMLNNWQLVGSRDVQF